MLQLENVSKRLGWFELKDISMELPSGYIMGLIGENGAGKTTLLHIVAGLYYKDKGRLTLDEMDNEEEESAMKQEMGVVFHEDMFDLRGTLIGNANRYGRFYHAYEESLFLEYASRFQLDVKKKYKKLSKGEKLKMAFAFALSHKPKLLLLDEPTANLDTEFRKTFLEVLREYTASGENSVILSTHIPSDVDKIADYLLFLKRGKQLVFGDIESIRASYRMVAGEAYKIRLLGQKVIHIEEGEFGCKALVHTSKRIEDLKSWEPSTEEFMYHMAKGGQ